MVVLQPAAVISDEVLVGALSVMRELMLARPDIQHQMHMSATSLFTYSAAAFWAVAKLIGNRTGESGCQVHGPPPTQPPVPAQPSAHNCNSVMHLNIQQRTTPVLGTGSMDSWGGVEQGVAGFKTWHLLAAQH
jgi:hypothetical protein